MKGNTVYLTLQTDAPFFHFSFYILLIYSFGEQNNKFIPATSFQWLNHFQIWTQYIQIFQIVICNLRSFINYIIEFLYLVNSNDSRYVTHTVIISHTGMKRFPFFWFTMISIYASRICQFSIPVIIFVAKKE